MEYRRKGGGNVSPVPVGSAEAGRGRRFPGYTRGFKSGNKRISSLGGGEGVAGGMDFDYEIDRIYIVAG